MTPEQIKALRIRLRMTQVQFAEALSVSEAAVKTWEGGSREPHKHTVALMKTLSPLRRAVK
jgi:DNA-binding transcriptional regulator YiaG